MMSLGEGADGEKRGGAVGRGERPKVQIRDKGRKLQIYLHSKKDRARSAKFNEEKEN